VCRAFALVFHVDFATILYFLCPFSVLFLYVCCLIHLCPVYFSFVNLYLYVVLFLLLAIWLLTRHINKQELD